MCVNNFPRVAFDSAADGIRTRDLLITNPAELPVICRRVRVFNQHRINKTTLNRSQTTRPSSHARQPNKLYSRVISSKVFEIRILSIYYITGSPVSAVDRAQIGLMSESIAYTQWHIQGDTGSCPNGCTIVHN